MILARWAGESVLRYVRDAPLDTLSAEVRGLEENRTMLATMEGIQGKLQRLEDRVEAGLAEVGQGLKVASAQASQPLARPFVAKGGQSRFKLHVVAVGGPEVLPALWRTKCGVKFAGWAFTRHASREDFPMDVLCRKCFAPLEAAGQESSSSSAGSSRASS